MTAVIGGERAYQVFITDNISKYYGNMDGYSFCRHEWSYTITNAPDWLQDKNNQISIGSFTELD